MTNAASGSWIATAASVGGSGEIALGGFTGADFAVLRLTPKGSLDSTFGTGGAVTTDFADRGDDSYGVFIQQDARILAAGTSSAGNDPGIALARYESDGGLDLTFGTSGTTLLPPPADTYYGVNGAALTPCSVVVVGLWSYNVNTLAKSAIGVARFHR